MRLNLNQLVSGILCEFYFLFHSLWRSECEVSSKEEINVLIRFIDMKTENTESYRRIQLPVIVLHTLNFSLHESMDVKTYDLSLNICLVSCGSMWAGHNQSIN